ncbi:30S ribosomal protein S4 [Marinitenerispora sediminis]|uniref:Small ribosomal subunit protein uS4 n=1 Tax=Marinitenerispora sediminis TaxID=1931232 RepID=A0A368T6W2_9ACTN|nr:30S ribosomal protein S4 [Marinitenerispora sediminis]RCV54133.1 30S ribosomal protein S4 [Marinitenerispora sediminis]RCV56779.1 30S ribosomal protein S4 [Marinitenerispora sediminis]RCV59626.1 30S ribosomal protein S4 [Marinitenerispora sediminis]
MRYTGPKVRLSRRAGTPLTRKAVSYFEKRPYPPGEHGRRVRRSTSDYAVRQAEKQKLRWYYDLSEKQLARVYETAKKRPGRTGEEMIAELELRLVTVVLRAGFAASIYAARQFISHGHITVDGKKVDIPSYLVKPGQIIGVREKSRNMVPFVEAAEGVHADDKIAGFLAVSHKELRIAVVDRPKREQVPVPFDEQLVVEYYAR